MEYEFSYLLQAMANRFHQMRMQPPIMMEVEEILQVERLLNRAAKEVSSVETLRAQIAALKRSKDHE